MSDKSRILFILFLPILSPLLSYKIDRNSERSIRSLLRVVNDKSQNLYKDPPLRWKITVGRAEGFISPNRFDLPSDLSSKQAAVSSYLWQRWTRRHRTAIDSFLTSSFTKIVFPIFVTVWLNLHSTYVRR